MNRLVLLAAVSAVLASPAAAQVLQADTNGNGKVNQAEYQTSRRNYLMHADYNRDGKISREEWTRAAKLERLDLQSQDVPNAKLVGTGNFFERIDVNKDGFVTPPEIDTFMAARFAGFDQDKDGDITRAEARKLEQSARASAK